MQFTTHAAKTQFSRLLAMVQKGEEVVITTGRDKKPVAKLISVQPKQGILLGAMRTIIGSPSPDEEVMWSLHSDEEWESIENRPL